MRWWSVGALLVAACRCVSQPAPGADPVAAIWAVSDGDVVERDSTVAPRTSLVWDGARVKLFAARNEVIAFQLIVRAGSGIGALAAALPELRHASGNRIAYAPPGRDPTDARGRPIQLFSVHYMDVTHASNADWIFEPGTASAPADPLGPKPVQLVPENARRGKGGFPVAVRAGETQALWFEIYTGTSNRPAGSYDGVIAVTAGGHRHEVPISLELLDFALPDANSLTAMVYYETEQPLLYQGHDLDAAYHRFAHRHRIELVNQYNVATAYSALARFDGRDFLPAASYEGPGQGTGNRVVPASFYSPGPGWEDRAAAWQRADDWIKFLDQRIPGAITFLYMPDEPAPSEYPGIWTIANNLHSNPGPGRRLPVFVTRGPTRELDGAIDTWCSGPRGFDAAQAAAERAKGHDWWVYNGGRPAGPALLIDAPPTDAREIGWASFKAGVSVYFYWHGVHWRHNAQKRVGDRNQNVWADPITFDKRDATGAGELANGDGVLLYPGTERVHPAEDRGIDGPIATLQLANLRRGLQDHLYLTLARQRGLEPLVGEVLAAIVPRVFSAASGAVSFPETSEPYEQARLRLGRALALH